MTTADLALHARTHDRRRVGEPLLVAAALALTYLIVAPASADLAAQVYRTDLFKEFGFTLWNGQWFAGHHTPGYSVLFPPLASVLGPRLVGALSAVAAAVLFERLTYPRWGSQARLGAIWFGAASATNLFTGRLTFALGVAIGLGALLAAQRERETLAISLAAVCSLASPIAGLFLALAGGAGWLASRRRVTLVMAASAFAVAAALAAAFPEGGVEPFVVSATGRPSPSRRPCSCWSRARRRRSATGPSCTPWPARRRSCSTRRWAATRRGWERCSAGRCSPACCGAGTPWRWRCWRCRSSTGSGCPPCATCATRAATPRCSSYYLPLNTFLAGARPPGRVEIPPTRNHWETVHVARRFSLARGWERQLDTSTTGSSTSPGWTRATTAPGCRPTACGGWRSRRRARLRRSPGGETRAVRPALPRARSGGTPTGGVYRYKSTVPLVSGRRARLPEVRRDHPPRLGERRGRSAPPLHPLLELVAGAAAWSRRRAGSPASFSSAPAPCA